MGGKVYIANFGRENYAWQECFKRSCIATMNAVEDQKYWLANDRESYVARRMKRKTWAGIYPTKPVASRWFNLMTIISESEGDIWIHKAKDELWWTTSIDQPHTFENMTEPVGGRPEVVVCYKPCTQWSNLNKKGNRLVWGSIHAKAQEFLITESTLQALRPENAMYALALISGESLTPWHSRPDWHSKQVIRGRLPGKVLSPLEKSIVRMARTALNTVANANGQTVERTVKNKDLLMNLVALEEHIAELIESQTGLCAISGLELQFDGAEDDKQMLASLDRIDSNGHYERGNLQVVCRFLNMWKAHRDDMEFKRLVAVLRDN